MNVFDMLVRVAAEFARLRAENERLLADRVNLLALLKVVRQTNFTDDYGCPSSRIEDALSACEGIKTP